MREQQESHFGQSATSSTEQTQLHRKLAVIKEGVCPLWELCEGWGRSVGGGLFFLMRKFLKSEVWGFEECKACRV